MKTIAQKTFVDIFFIGMITWMAFVISTALLPPNPLASAFTSVLGLEEDFVARPKVVEHIESFDDFIYSDYVYGFYFFCTVIVLSGLFTLTKSRSLIEKYTLLQAYALPREREYWAKVTDGATHKPVPFAVISIFRVDEKGDETFTIQTVADTDGRYRLHLTEININYVLEAKSPGYEVFRERLQSGAFESNNTLRMNIILERGDMPKRTYSIGQILMKYRAQILSTLTGFILFISFTTFIHAIYSLFAHFNFVSVGDLVFYGFAFPWNVFVLLERRRFNPGRIINVMTKQPISNVSVQLYSGTKQLASLFTDKMGVARFDADPGEYEIKIVRPGFIIRGKEGNMLYTEITKEGYIKRDVYLQPISQWSDKDRSLQNPFHD